jgi:P2-related tail formation protein
MFKNYISDNDVTPEVLKKFNSAVAMGFTTLENLANQIVDLESPNSLHEALIPYLSNYFNLKLKTADPTRWRGQIVRAIPLFKEKGTRRALGESFEHAAMKLTRIKQLWQVISNYTWQESFIFDGVNFDFVLEKTIITPIDVNNLMIWIQTSRFCRIHTTNSRHDLQLHRLCVVFYHKWRYDYVMDFNNIEHC